MWTLEWWNLAHAPVKDNLHQSSTFFPRPWRSRVKSLYNLNPKYLLSMPIKENKCLKNEWWLLFKYKLKSHKTKLNICLQEREREAFVLLCCCTVCSYQTMQRKKEKKMFVCLSGLPAVSVPSALSAKGLPIGLQFIGRAFHELQLLTVARWFETQVRFPALDLEGITDPLDTTSHQEKSAFFSWTMMGKFIMYTIKKDLENYKSQCIKAFNVLFCFINETLPIKD